MTHILNLFNAAKRRFPGLPLTRTKLEGDDYLWIDGWISIHREVRDVQVRDVSGIRTVETPTFVVTTEFIEVGYTDALAALADAVKIHSTEEAV